MTADRSGPSVAGSRPDQLQTLAAMANAVAVVHTFEDLLELIAEHACAACGAASLSISRLEEDDRVLRTLVNVGQLGPGEERRPAHELYRLDDFPIFRTHLFAGEPLLESVDDPQVDAAELELMQALGKIEGLTVPIVVGGRVWGELWATRTAGRQPFGSDDIAFLSAVTGHVATAIAQAENIGRLSAYAYEDPLTHLANRRGLQETLERAFSVPHALALQPVSLVAADVDGLKAINDTGGHAAGDQLLATVAQALRVVAGESPGAVAFRTGGDEFCLFVPEGGRREAERLARTAVTQLAALSGGPIGLSCGIASTEAGHRSPSELLAAADAALYTAKRSGDHVVPESDAGGAAAIDSGVRRRFRDTLSVERFLVAIDDRLGTAKHPQSGDTLARVRAIAGEAARWLGASRAYVTIDSPDEHVDGDPECPVPWGDVLATGSAVRLLRRDEDVLPRAVSAASDALVVGGAVLLWPRTPRLCILWLEFPPSAVPGTAAVSALRLALQAAAATMQVDEALAPAASLH